MFRCSSCLGPEVDSRYSSLWKIDMSIYTGDIISILRVQSRHQSLITAYSHPPSTSSSLSEGSSRISLTVQRHMHRRHQRLPCTVLHLSNVAPLRVFVYSEQAERKYSFKLNGYVWMQALSLWYRSAVCQCCRWRIGNVGLVFDHGETALHKLMGMLPPESNM